MISSSHQTDVLPPPPSPPTSLILNNNEEEIHSYSEQSSYSNGCLKIGRKKEIISNNKVNMSLFDSLYF